MADQISRAVERTVYGSELSTEQIAEKIGMSAQILRNKANDNNSHNHLTLREAVALMKATQNHSIYRAIGGVIEDESVPEKSIVELVLSASAESGDVVRVFTDAHADGRISAAEKKAIHNEINQAMDALNCLAKAIDEDGTPASLRTVF